MTHGSKTMDVSNMLNKIMKERNGGKDNAINSTQAEILRDVGRTIVHMASQDGATIKGACVLIDVMIRTLRVGRISNTQNIQEKPFKKTIKKPKPKPSK